MPARCLPKLLGAASLVVSLAGSPVAPLHAADEIVVTANLRADEPLARLPASVTVVEADVLERSAVQHFEELAAQVPNLNWSGEGARARYFQLRGAGELEQYEGAPNASIGFMIDDIDFSGIGGIATRFGLERIEVLRGPQGTRYGANALAGLIYARSAAPPATASVSAEALWAGDATYGVGVTAGGPLAGPALTGRLTVHQYGSDGPRRNAWLERATHDQDELTLRGKLRWQAPGGWQADLTGVHVDLDNGYDAWALDNSWTTRSDRPGVDAQRSAAAALRLTGPLAPGVELVSITGGARSEIRFSFDADWGNPALWAPDVYDFTQATTRERRTLNQELRLVSTEAGRLWGRADWLAGIYALALDEDNRIADRGLLDLDDAACPPPDEAFCAPFAVDRDTTSDYAARSLALFGELGLPLGATTRVALGLRGERRDTRYRDRLDDRISGGVTANRFEPTDRLWGGELTITHETAGGLVVWGRLARGYRAGGFNPSLARIDFAANDLALSPAQIPFDAEALWNVEAGLRHTGARLSAGASIFRQERDDMQVRVPLQLAIGDPNTFVFLTDNAESAHSHGFEADLSWQLAPTVSLRAALGLLATELRRFRAAPRFEGRSFPHAPRWNYAVGVDWQGQSGWLGQVEVTGRDSFAFDYDGSSGAEREAAATTLVHLRAGRRVGAWTVEFFVRNLFDAEYATRGFFFGNEPPALVPTRYLRLGDPRQAGVQLRWSP